LGRSADGASEKSDLVDLVWNHRETPTQPPKHPDVPDFDNFDPKNFKDSSGKDLDIEAMMEKAGLKGKFKV
jgi:hypothetical protein